MNAQIPYLFINIIAFASFFLIFLMMAAARKTPEIRAFIALLVDCMLWSGSSVLMRMQLWPGLDFWYYVSILALFFMEFLLYWFVHVFAGEKGKLILLLSFLATIAVLPGTITGYYLAPPTPVTTASGDIVFTYVADWHILIPCALLVFFVFVTLRLFLRLVREKGVHTPGLLILIYGSAILCFGSVLQVVLPGNTFPYDMLSGILFAVLLFWSLYRRRMFQMTLVVSRGFLVASLFGIGILSAIYLVVPTEAFLHDQVKLAEDTSLILVTILFAAFAGLLYMLLNQATNRIFIRSEKRTELVNTFSREVSGTLHSSEIMSRLSALMLEVLPVQNVYVLLKKGQEYRAQFASNSLASLSFSIRADSPVLAYLTQWDDYLVVSEFKSNPLYLSVWDSEKQMLAGMSADCIVAMKDGKDTLGLVLLCGRRGGKSYSAEEIGFARTITSVASIAMKNAGLFEAMYREARIDSLTGAYNYRAFIEREQALFASCGREGLSLLFVDMDDFKLFNQLYGVSAGDEVLRRIYQQILQCTGDAENVFRAALDAPQKLSEHVDSVIGRLEWEDTGYRSAMLTVSALTAAIDAKDHYTFAHSKNVARYAACLAAAAGLNDDQVRTIYTAGLLHDIGKISIPESILKKTGRLTEDEYAVMKEHVNHSIEMIRYLPEMDYLIPATLGHHERWDGNGYPRGIAGDQIPISARCLAIADVYDAMTTDRPYRRAVPQESALKQIRDGEGTQFDPQLAELFIRIVSSREFEYTSSLQQHA
jgi:putative nucleotidyltransferase with HDIG domain